MVKKICRWAAVVLPLGLILPMFLNVWEYFVQDSEGAVMPTWTLFQPFNEPYFTMESSPWAGVFSSVWMTLFMITAVLALLVGLALAVIFLLDNLGKTKLHKFERIGSWSLLGLTGLGIAFGAVATIVNVVVEEGKIVAAINGTTGLYVFMLVGLAASVAALIGSCRKQNTEKIVAIKK